MGLRNLLGRLKDKYNREIFNAQLIAAGEAETYDLSLRHLWEAKKAYELIGNKEGLDVQPMGQILTAGFCKDLSAEVDEKSISNVFAEQPFSAELQARKDKYEEDLVDFGIDIDEIIGVLTHLRKQSYANLVMRSVNVIGEAQERISEADAALEAAADSGHESTIVLPDHMMKELQEEKQRAVQEAMVAGIGAKEKLLPAIVFSVGLYDTVKRAGKRDFPDEELAFELSEMPADDVIYDTVINNLASFISWQVNATRDEGIPSTQFLSRYEKAREVMLECAKNVDSTFVEYRKVKDFIDSVDDYVMSKVDEFQEKLEQEEDRLYNALMEALEIPSLDDAKRITQDKWKAYAPFMATYSRVLGETESDFSRTAKDVNDRLRERGEAEEEAALAEQGYTPDPTKQHSVRVNLSDLECEA